MQRQGPRTAVWATGLTVLCAAASAAAADYQRQTGAPTNEAGQPVKDENGQPLSYQKIEWLRVPTLNKPPKAQKQPKAGATLAIKEPTWTYVAFGTNIGGRGLTAATVAGTTEIYATASGSGWGGASYWYALTKTSTSLTDGLKQTYASAEFESPIVKLSVAKFATGEQRIVLALEDGTLVQYDAATKQLKDRSAGPCSSHNGQQAFATGDLNGDGTDEFISVCTDNTLVTHGPSYKTWSLAGIGGGGIALGQMDNDAAIEIATTAGKVVDSVSKAVQWTRSEGFGGQVLAADIDGDGRDELIANEGWINAYDVEKRLPKWSIQGGATIALGDVTGDGVRELLVGDDQWGSVHAFDMSTQVEIGQIANPEHGVTNILVTDVNGDGVSELLWGAGATSSGSDFLYVSTWATKHIEWQNLDLTGPFIGPVAGDLDGDGIDEIVFASSGSNADYDSGRIIVLDSRTLAVRGVSAPVVDNLSWTGIRDLRLGDTNGDGRLEILIAADRLYDGAMEAYKFTRKNAFVRTASIIDNEAQAFSSVAAADVEGDGHIELLGGSTDFVIAYDPATGQRKWRSPVQMDGSARDLVIGDLDADGALEFAAMANEGKPYIHDGVTHSLEALIDIAGTSMSSVARPSGLHLLIGDASGVVHEMAYKNGAYVEVKSWSAANGPIDGVTAGAAVWVGSQGQLRTFSNQGALRYESVNLGGHAGRQVVRVKNLGLDLTTGSMGLYGLPYKAQ
jgi:hypothetical protein